jgi:hypothetical protein
MSGLRRRLKRLEGGRPCSGCGTDPDAPVVVEIARDKEIGDFPEESSPPCPRCGRHELTVVDWPDLPESRVPGYPPWSDEGGEG